MRLFYETFDYYLVGAAAWTIIALAVAGCRHHAIEDGQEDMIREGPHEPRAQVIDSRSGKDVMPPLPEVVH